MTTNKNKCAIGTLTEIANGGGQFYGTVTAGRKELQKRLKSNPDAIYGLFRYVSTTELELVEVIQNRDGAEFEAEIDRLQREIDSLREELESVVV
jgi:flagellar capping protein FliD